MGLKEQLEQAGYDTSQLDENKLISKLNDAGYDTSSIAPEKPSAIKQVMDTVKTATMLPTQGLNKLGDMVQKGAQKAGEFVAEKAGGAGYPTAGAVAGTGIAMLPDIIGSLPMGGEAAAKAPEAIDAVKGLMGNGGNKLRTMAEALIGPGEQAGRNAMQEAVQPLEQRLVAQKGALSTLPERIASRGDALKQAKAGYGAAIGKAEQVGGFAETATPSDFIETIKDPKALNEFSNTMRKLADTPLEDLVKTKDTGMLQTARKFGQTFREIGPKLNKEITSTISANIKMGAGKSTEALSKIDETFGSAVDAWEKADTQLKNLPSSAGKQKAAITQATRQTQYAIKQTKAAMQEAIKAGAKRDDLRKTLLKYGLGGLVGGTAFKLFH